MDIYYTIGEPKLTQNLNFYSSPSTFNFGNPTYTIFFNPPSIIQSELTTSSTPDLPDAVLEFETNLRSQIGKHSIEIEVVMNLDSPYLLSKTFTFNFYVLDDVINHAPTFLNAAFIDHKKT